LYKTKAQRIEVFCSIKDTLDKWVSYWLNMRLMRDCHLEYKNNFCNKGKDRNFSGGRGETNEIDNYHRSCFNAKSCAKNSHTHNHKNANKKSEIALIRKTIMKKNKL
jgi:hypothetical protein